MLQFALAGAERRGELVLYAHQIALPEDGTGQVDLSDARVGNPDHEHLARVQQLLQDPDRLLVGDLRVGPVVLVQPDGLARRAGATTLRRRCGCKRVHRLPSSCRRRDGHGRPWWRPGRSPGRRPTTPALWLRAPRHGLCPPRPGCRRRRCRPGSSRRPIAAWMVSMERASSGRPSMDMGISPRPIAPTWREPIRRSSMGPA